MRSWLEIPVKNRSLTKKNSFLESNRFLCATMKGESFLHLRGTVWGKPDRAQPSLRLETADAFTIQFDRRLPCKENVFAFSSPA
jgi:hypothetical protein